MKHPASAALAPILVAAVFSLFTACVKKNAQTNSSAGTSIGVFIPGVMSGSPVYEMLVEGVRAAVNRHNGAQGAAAPVELTVIEGGYNQAEWETKLTAMTASFSYDLIVSSNPSLPDIVSHISDRFPDQHFLLLDGRLEGNPRVYTLRYNQREQSYMAGYMAALISEAAGPAPARRVGLVAAQEYPVMNNVILPGFLEGARGVNGGYTVDFRIVGNWYDAAKAGELAADMIQGGVQVLLCIAGGANEGVIHAAAEGGARVIWFDTNGYGIRPGIVAGSSVLYQDKAAYTQMLRYLEGTLPFGTAETLGLSEGYVDFIQDDPVYIETVAPELRERQASMIERIRSGALALPL
ncbi:MAG: BMP family ABC transporter substrate-binding protein [Spirochaetaceae bacterium]|jgi:simple sugar transport system substrate-binding protein|nr:BMP family ABC transporter substrate-binding protein [Spirochaetaceae bacterium]